jgi:hypothetical protein
VNEIERIHQMVRDGRITAEEGERLIQVLREVDEVDARLDQEAQAIDREARGAHDDSVGSDRTAAVAANAATNAATASEANTDATTAAADSATAAADSATTAPTAAEDATGTFTPPAGDTTVTGTDAAPAGTPFVHVVMLAGDLEVRVDPSLTEPHVSGGPGKLGMERHGADFQVNFRPEGSGYLDRFLTQMRSGKVSVTIPEGYGVDLNMRAGNVRLHGVPYLRGRLTAGDLSADALRGVDLTNAAGDIDVRLLLTEGKHRISSATGDVDVVLVPGSDVRVEGSVSIGDAEAGGAAFTTERSGLGDRVTGTIGAGSAFLEIRVTTGDVHVEVDHG